MIYGYVRVSTPKQNNERQIRNILSRYPDAVIYEDIHTRTNFTSREAWEELMDIVSEGDTIVFDSVSRMSGNVKEGVITYEELFDKNVELVFLNEPHINTSVYKEAMNVQFTLTGTITDIIIEAINKFQKALAKQQIILAFEQAEKEILDLHQRTIEGLETARKAGRRGGRARISKAKQFQIHSMYYSEKYSIEQIKEKCGVSRATIFNYLKLWQKYPKLAPNQQEFIEETDGDNITISSVGRPSISDETIQDMIDLYEYSNLSKKKIAEHFNVSESTVKKYCSGVEKRHRKKGV